MSRDLQDKHILQFDSKEIYFLKTGGLFSRSYDNGKFYESKMLIYIRSLGLKGRYLDIGGCIGNHSVFFSLLCPSTSVEIFEPLQEGCELIQTHIAINNLRNVNLHQIGLGDEVKEVTTTFSGKEVTFRTELLDSFNFSDIVVIKIDIEGMEHECLMGARETLIKNSPVIFMEAHTEDDIIKQKSVLEPLGYKMTGKVWNASPTYEWVKQARVLKPVFSNMGTHKKCLICGNESFKPGPNGRLAAGVPPRCAKCRSLERHRIIYGTWKSIDNSILKTMNCLHFAPDQCVEKNWFKSYTPSTYEGENHIDIQNIHQYPDQYWDIVIANHVLEHIPDDIQALREIRRVLNKKGVFQFAIPLVYSRVNPNDAKSGNTPGQRHTLPAEKTDDWGYPDPQQHGHIRNYGLDFMEKLCQAFQNDFLLTHIGYDVVTGAQDYVFFVGDEALLKKMGKKLKNVHLEKLKQQKKLIAIERVEQKTRWRKRLKRVWKALFK